MILKHAGKDIDITPHDIVILAYLRTVSCCHSCEQVYLVLQLAFGY